MPKTAIIAGASGLVGSHLLSHLLLSNNYGQVIVLTRKPLLIKHPKLDQRLIDFNNIELLYLQADDVFCCLGTTINKAGSKAAFRKVDFEYPLQLAKTCLRNGAKQFLLVSAMGANAKSVMFYNKTKGEIENAIAGLKFATCLIFRPSLLLGNREEKRFGEKLAIKITSLLGFIFKGPLKKYKPIDAEKVAKAMADAAQNDLQGLVVIESSKMG